MHRAVGLDAELGVLVAVHLDERPLPGRDDRGAQLVGVLGEHLGEGAHAGRRGAAASGSSGSSSGASARSAAVQDGSSPTTGTPAASHGSIVRRLRRSTRRAASTWPVRGPGEPAADVRGGQLDGVAERLEHGDGVGGDGGVEVVGEGVGPQQQPAAGGGARSRPGRGTASGRQRPDGGCRLRGRGRG